MFFFNAFTKPNAWGYYVGSNMILAMGALSIWYVVESIFYVKYIKTTHFRYMYSANNETTWHECQICFEPCSSNEQYTRPIDIVCDCNHIDRQHFIAHCNCFNQWLTYRKKCPICRTPILIPIQNHLESESQQDVLNLTVIDGSQSNVEQYVNQNSGHVPLRSNYSPTVSQLFRRETDRNCTQTSCALANFIGNLFGCCPSGNKH